MGWLEDAMMAFLSHFLNILFYKFVNHIAMAKKGEIWYNK